MGIRNLQNPKTVGLLQSGFGVLYVAILGLGALSIWLLMPWLELTDAGADRNVLALFVPFGCVAVLILWVSLRGEWSGRVGVLVVSMYVILSFNLYGFFFEPIWHFHFDDPWRYSTYALLILSIVTLWGGDAMDIHVETAFRSLREAGRRRRTTPSHRWR